MAARKDNGSRPRNGGRPKIDWNAALRTFLEIGPARSLAEVARRYGVSEGAVRKHAKAESWEAVAATVDAEVRRRNEVRAVKTLEERQADTIAVADALRQIALDRKQEIHPEVAARAIPRYAVVERLIAGEATDRVEMSEVTRKLDAIMEWALRHIPPGERERALAELEVALAGGQQEAA